MITSMSRLPAVAVVCAVLAIAPGSASGMGRQAGPGGTTSGTVTSNGVEHSYLLHTPSSYDEDRPAPLVVVVHGCQTTAQQEMELTEFNELAEREGFVVLYPEVDELGRQLPGPLNNCWRFFDPTAYFRGNGDAAAIAEMTRRVMSDTEIDDERVYLVGVSAGGLMTSASAASYPDLYTAVGIVTSAGYADGPCFTTGIGIPAEVSALLAFSEMGPRARVVPAIVIGSDADLAFPASCTNKAIAQSLRTNNLVLSGAQEGPLALTPATVSEERVPNGLAYTVSRFADPGGCLVGERWLIHGMPHAWPGGAPYGGYTDTRAPDGAEATWAFLERFRKSETSTLCAEAPTEPPTAKPSTPEPAAPGTLPAPSAEAALPASSPPGPALPRTGGGGALATSALLAILALALGAVARTSRPRPAPPR